LDTINVNTKKCGFCGEDIAADFRRCPYCGSLLNLKNESDNAVDTESVPISNNIESYENVSMNFDVEHINNSSSINSEEGTSLQNPGAEENRSYYGIKTDMVRNREYPGNTDKKTLSNAKKVFITTICNMVPGFGQLVGLIIAIVFLNSEEDEDKRSFGVALLITSLIVFVISCLFYLLLGVFFTSILNSVK